MGVAEVRLIHCYNSSEMTFRGLSKASPRPLTGPAEVTRLLVDWQRGDKLALDQLMPLVYRELRKVAASYLKDERRNHTLQPTALIHESYLRMVEQHFPQWQNRAHFFGVAAKLMRQILVDHARSRRASKRGGDQIKITLHKSLDPPLSKDGERVLTLDAALTKLATFDERKSRVVEMRVFGGMKLSDIAAALDVSEPTIKRDMRLAKAWLRIELAK
jgi:RNA polymerase sigma-70 factor (ECF subfamily)